MIFGNARSVRNGIVASHDNYAIPTYSKSQQIFVLYESGSRQKRFITTETFVVLYVRNVGGPNNSSSIRKYVSA